MTQSKHQIQELLTAAGARPLKRYGQNFLIDQNLMHKLLEAAELEPADVVLEVGPGTGSLTEELVQRCGHVVAVEIDNTLQAIVRDRLEPTGRCTVIHRDVLARKSQIAPEVRDTLISHQRRLGGRILLVANLPYQAATPLVVDLLLGDLRCDRLCFMVQAEVADRVVSPCGRKEYGPVSIFAQLLTRARRIARVPPQAFWPAPQVDSAMVRLDWEPPEGFVSQQLASVVRLVHSCFNHRRKTMRSNLRALLPPDQLEALVTVGGWDLQQRPEELAPADWWRLAGQIGNELGG